MRVRPWFAAVALACVCGGADAQTVLSEADAIATLSADSPRVRAIRSGIELARADVLSASRWPNPRLYIGREAVAGVSETIMAQTTIDYLERRYAALEKEIEEALHQSPTDDLAVADLKSRKLIIADEIQHNHRLIEHFSKLGVH